MLKKFLLLLLIFLTLNFDVSAINDLHIIDNTIFDILTSDTSVPVTIIATAGGQATNVYVESNYIDITLDNLSNITFSVPSGQFFKTTKISGSDSFTVNPECPTNTVTMAGTGASVVLRLEVQGSVVPCTTTTTTGGGGGSSYVILKNYAEKILEENRIALEESQGEISETCGRTKTSPIPFIDISTHWAQSYIDTLYRTCIVDGRTNTFFQPDGYATRAEILKVVLKTYGHGESPYSNGFLDVFLGDWYAGYIETAMKLGIVIGYLNDDGSSNFKPNQYISRAEALKIILKTKGIINYLGYTENFSDVSESDWFYSYVAYAQSKKILHGYAETIINVDGAEEVVLVFKPNSNISRAELAKIDLMVKDL